MFKSKSLNLFSPDGATKFDIDVLNDKVDINCEQKVVIRPTLDLGTEHPNVGGLLTSIKADIINNFADSKTASNLVQTNLDTFAATTNAAIGALQTGLASETAQRTAAVTAEATIRSNQDAATEAKLAQETSDRKSAVDTLTADIAQEAGTRAAADASEASLRAAAIAVLQANIDTEKARIDSVLNGSSVDLNSLKEIVDTFKASGSNTLQIITGIQSQVTALQATLATLTEGTVPSSQIIESVVAGLTFVNGSAWMTAAFSINYDLTDRYDFSVSSYVGWDQVKAETIAASGGALTGSSSDSEVEAFINAALQAQYGDKYSGSPYSATLAYEDFDHYLVRVGMPSGSKPLFQGSAVSGAADVTWRLDYCTTPGDASTAYSTIMSGKQVGKNLVLVPDNVQTPVNGLAGTRVGYKSSTDSLTVQ